MACNTSIIGLGSNLWVARMVRDIRICATLDLVRVTASPFARPVTLRNLLPIVEG